jgi:hypothetical protein
LTAASPGGAREWQPIETAPKDFTSVLVTGDQGFVCEATYNADYDGWWAANTHPTDAYDGQVYPTHWMPLPDAPHDA